MTLVKYIGNHVEDKIYACKVRQRDTGWGYALAYWFPYSGIWHIITRRTLTPFTSLVASVIAVLVISSELGFTLKDEGEQSENTQALTLLVFILASGTTATKLSIDWDRKRGREFLDQYK